MATVDNHYVRAALNCAARKGVPVLGLMSHVGCSSSELNKPGGRTHADQMTRLVQTIWSELRDEFMGCTQHPCKPGAFAFMSRHALHYDSLEAVLEQGIIFYNLFTDDITMRLDRQAKTASLEIEFMRPDLDPDHFYQEFWMVIWHRFSSWITDKKIPLTQACFPYAKPKHCHELKELFPCRHQFNCSVMKISFSTDSLALPPTRTQRELSGFLRNSPADLITIPGEENSYRGRIRAILLNQESLVLQCPDFEQLAESFNMSSQTLRRRLQQEGSAYSMIKDEIRYDLSIEKLVVKRLSVAEVAHLLGYAEPRSFSRAFKEWTGLTPTDYIKLKSDKRP